MKERKIMKVQLQVILALVCAAFSSVVGVSSASAVTISVPATATGDFGAPAAATTNFILGKAVTFAPDQISETVRITASGLIDIGLGPNVTPDGVSISIGASPSEFSPLEEKVIDAGGSLPARTGLNYGAVIYAFVPAAIANNMTFLPHDEDTTTLGIDADWLFLAGSGPTDITVTQAGTFYIGINDTYASNNSGSFSVTLETIAQQFPTPAPEPSSFLLLSLGALGLVRNGRRRMAQA